MSIQHLIPQSPKKVGILTLAKISRHKDLKQLQVYYRETADSIAKLI